MSASSKHEAMTRALGEHYGKLFRKYGDAPETAQYRTRPSHWARFRPLADMIYDPESSILDWGCGVGELLRFLTEERGYRGRYTGYDICPEVIAHARATHPAHRFEQRNIFDAPIPDRFDYVLVSGVFNNRVPGGDNDAYMKDALRALMPAARKGLAFNALSRYVDYRDDGLFYCDPEEIFSFCKESLSPLVTLRHDYLINPDAPPYEFTVYVHATAQTPRRKIPA